MDVSQTAGLSAHLATQRLRLRPLRPDDAPWIAREIARPQVHRMLTRPPYPYRLSDAEDFVARRGRRPGCWMIEGAGRLGIVSLQTHLGYWLAPPAWGRGVMTEAAGAVVDDWFAHRTQDVTSGYITDNPASGRVLRKLGFRDGPLVAERSNFRGAEVPLRRVTLTRADWVERRRQGA